MATPVLPRHRLACPTEEQAVESLTRVLGWQRAAAAWQAAVTAAGLDAAPRPLALLDLHRVAEQLAAQPELTGVIGTALRIRVETYRCLAPEEGAA